MGARDLVALGVGVIVGGGIFTTIGPGVLKAGPAVIIAFALAGLASLVAALCYAELATIMPSAGSAYAFNYSAPGQIFGWLIGWNLVLEYTVGRAPVAQQFLQSLQILASSAGDDRLEQALPWTPSSISPYSDDLWFAKPHLNESMRKPAIMLPEKCWWIRDV